MRKHVRKNSLTTYVPWKKGTYRVYDDLTGWPMLNTEMKVMHLYSGKGNLIAHKDIAYPIDPSLVPWTPPVERPGPYLSRTNHNNTTAAVGELDISTTDPMSISDPENEL
jgi:hypothetical protein